MKIKIRSSTLILLVLALSLNFEQTIETFISGGKNSIFFERMNCRTFPGSKVSAVQCRVKYIDRNHLRGNLFANLSKPLYGLWIHGVIYYKYNTYQKIATEYWDDICGWLGGKTKSFLLDYFTDTILKLTNANHSCPYTGLVYGRFDNMTVNTFAFPQMAPSGRYRLDFNFYEGDRKTLLGNGSLYGGISDHRIEIV